MLVPLLVTAFGFALRFARLLPLPSPGRRSVYGAG
jgi:hypothetical protein